MKERNTERNNKRYFRSHKAQPAALNNRHTKEKTEFTLTKISLTFHTTAECLQEDTHSQADANRAEALSGGSFVGGKGEKEIAKPVLEKPSFGRSHSSCRWRSRARDPGWSKRNPLAEAGESVHVRHVRGVGATSAAATSAAVATSTTATAATSTARRVEVTRETLRLFRAETHVGDDLFLAARGLLAVDLLVLRVHEVGGLALLGDLNGAGELVGHLTDLDLSEELTRTRRLLLGKVLVEGELNLLLFLLLNGSLLSSLLVRSRLGAFLGSSLSQLLVRVGLVAPVAGTTTLLAGLLTTARAAAALELTARATVATATLATFTRGTAALTRATRLLLVADRSLLVASLLVASGGLVQSHGGRRRRRGLLVHARRVLVIRVEGGEKVLAGHGCRARRE
eukprot:jgi/Phyca11/568096/estExt2_Genewise1.C_PHYCAscaffold_270335